MNTERAAQDLAWARDALKQYREELDKYQWKLRQLVDASELLWEVLKDCDRPTRIAFCKAYRNYVSRVSGRAQEAAS